MQTKIILLSFFQVSDPTHVQTVDSEDDHSKGELVTRSESPELLLKHPLQVSFSTHPFSGIYSENPIT